MGRARRQWARLWVPAWALMALVLWRCSDQIEANGPYRERASVFGLLNVTDSVHYIRIQKTFLTIREPDAYKAAQVKDSIYYTGDDVLDVRLYLEMPRLDTIELGRLERVEATGKDSGIFHAPDHLLYRFLGRLIPEDSFALRLALFRNPQPLLERRIRLEILNLRTGYHVRARTKLVYPIWDDRTDAPFFGRYSLLGPARFPEPDGRKLQAISPSVRFSRHANGTVFKTLVYIPFVEVYPGGRRDTLEAVWTLMADREVPPGEPTVSREFGPGESPLGLFESLLAQVDTNKPVAYRQLLPLRIRVLAADSNLYNYVVTSSRFSPITQTAPIFTNIEGGLGLFASRADKSFQAGVFEEAYILLGTKPYSAMRFQK